MSEKPILQGRAALVTGAGRGIGAAVAALLARHGATVAVHYGNDEAAAAAVCDGLDGGGHGLVGADLADPDAALALADRAASVLGGLDIVVNNAGVFTLHDVADLDAESWRRVWDHTLAVNLSGPAHVIRGAVPILAESGGGHIVNISSRGAFRGEPEAPGYGASKAGLNSLSQSLAVALTPRGIVVVAVAPGWVLTDMTREHLAGPRGDAVRGQSPSGRLATAEEVAEVVLLAVSGRADAMSGGVVDVNAASHLRA